MSLIIEVMAALTYNNFATKHFGAFAKLSDNTLAFSNNIIILIDKIIWAS